MAEGASGSNDQNIWQGVLHGPLAELHCLLPKVSNEVYIGFEYLYDFDLCSAVGQPSEMRDMGRSRLKEIDQPVLVMYGSNDRIMGEKTDYYRQIASEMPNAT